MNHFQRRVLFYSDMGIPVFPVEPQEKPLGRLAPGGFKDATTDQTVLRRWWRAVPGANIGMPTGHWSDVIDFDQLDPDNLAYPPGLAELGVPPGDTILAGPVVLTGRGAHLHVQPTGIGNKTHIQGEPIDFRGLGGYVLLPPSVHSSGAVYEWLEIEAPLQPLPEWLRLAIDPPKPEHELGELPPLAEQKRLRNSSGRI